MNTKVIIWLAITAVLMIIIYSLYMIIQMSSTLPSIKKYSYRSNVESFEDTLMSRINSNEGWHYEKTESTGSQDNRCHYATLTYTDSVDRIGYRIKFCSDDSEENGCVSVYLIGAFDEMKNTGGYKVSDSGVLKLVDNLDQTLLLNILPICL